MFSCLQCLCVVCVCVCALCLLWKVGANCDRQSKEKSGVTWFTLFSRPLSQTSHKARHRSCNVDRFLWKPESFNDKLSLHDGGRAVTTLLPCRCAPSRTTKSTAWRPPGFSLREVKVTNPTEVPVLCQCVSVKVTGTLGSSSILGSTWSCPRQSLA